VELIFVMRWRLGASRRTKARSRGDWRQE